jgi:hypothetical protein
MSRDAIRLSDVAIKSGLDCTTGRSFKPGLKKNMRLGFGKRICSSRDGPLFSGQACNDEGVLSHEVTR